MALAQSVRAFPISVKLLSYTMIAFLGGIAIGDFFRHQQWLGQQTVASAGTVRAVALRYAEKHLPDWRMTTDCSAYSRDCVLAKLRDHTYDEYPFKVAQQYDQLYRWEPKLPEGWFESLRQHSPRQVPVVPNNTHAIQECARTARAKTVDQQLDSLLASMQRQSDMVSFTISDYSYTRDMMQDVFEMAYNVVGFSDSFFMVAMDVATMELACKYNYPFLAWPQPSTEEKGALKNAVANTKFDISYALLKRKQSFFFFEMDVWFVQSPMPFLEQQTEDILFSGHQNNPGAANIGVYSVRANNATEEFFRLSIEILEQSPETHDQLVIQQMGWFTDSTHAGQPLEYSSHFKEPLPKVPKIQHPVNHKFFSPFQIVADERPVVTEDTLAIHPLCGAPLRTPHGKKMVAKELGAWYGAGTYFDHANRYLWLDGHTWNAFSMVMTWPGFRPHVSYHHFDKLQWTIAATVALARQTGRIWVMPKVLNDKGVHFLWTILDMESVEALVAVRETNFPTNRKAWHTRSQPFQTVARTALGDSGRIYAQPHTETTLEGIRAWKVTEVGHDLSPLDAWFAIHTTIPELVEAQVLLAGLPGSMDVFEGLRQWMLDETQKLGIAELEIKNVFEQLRWCAHKFVQIDQEKTVGMTAAEWDCYGMGQPAKSIQRA